MELNRRELLQSITLAAPAVGIIKLPTVDQTSEDLLKKWREAERNLHEAEDATFSYVTNTLQFVREDYHELWAKEIIAHRRMQVTRDLYAASLMSRERYHTVYVPYAKMRNIEENELSSLLCYDLLFSQDTSNRL